MSAIKEGVMLNAQDLENLTKAAQCANLLTKNIRAVVSADNPLLAEIALGLQEEAVAIEHRLQRLMAITQS